jgi:hypothetical protein
MVVRCGRVMRVLVYGAILTENGSSWEKNVITTNFNKEKSYMQHFYPILLMCDTANQQLDFFLINFFSTMPDPMANCQYYISKVE